MNNSRTIRWVAATALIVTVACSDGGSPSSSTSSTDDAPSAADEPQQSAEPLFAGLELSVTLLTTTTGGGHRPLLEWEPVAQADHYSAYLYAPSGDVYWVWSGRDTSVHVGGEPRLDDAAPGPSLVEGMTWAVLAHDPDGVPLAVSDQRAIGP